MKFRMLWISILLCVPAPLLLAQGGSTGTILGTVTDNSGAVIARAGVDITNVGTGVTTHAVTSSAGDFTAPYLTSGTYKIVVESAGFQKGVTDNIPLAVAQQVRVNVQLLPGSVAQSVEVSANQVSMDTDTSAVSQEISRRQVNDLPLNGRNFLDLLRLTPGQVTATTEASSFRQGAESGISINGQRATSNSYTLDGMPNIDASEAQAAVILSVDAIQEFAVQSSTYGAQLGFSASQVNLVTRGGTNNLHGHSTNSTATTPSMRRVLFKPPYRLYDKTNLATPRAARYTFPTCTTAETRPSGSPAMRVGASIRAQTISSSFLHPTRWQDILPSPSTIRRRAHRSQGVRLMG